MTGRRGTRAGTVTWLCWSAAGIVVTFGALVLLGRWMPARPGLAGAWLLVAWVELQVRQVFPRRAPQWLLALAYSVTFIGFGLVFPALWPDTWHRDGALLGLVIGIVLLSFGAATAVFADRYIPRRTIDAEIERYRRSVEDA